jgi:hypothetical protein
MRVAETFRNEAVERLPDSVVCLAAKHPFGAMIEQKDLLLSVNGDDCIHCRIKDASQSSLAFTQGGTFSDTHGCHPSKQNLDAPSRSTAHLESANKCAYPMWKSFQKNARFNLW